MNRLCVCVVLIALLCWDWSAFAQNLGVRKVSFGKYDEYSFFLYEESRTIVQHKKLVVALVVDLYEHIQCEYKFVLHMPEAPHDLLVWNLGEWKKLGSGGHLSSSTSNKTVTHTLRKDVYTVQGFYHSGDSRGVLRALYRVESLPLGQYKLDVYIQNVLVQNVDFTVHQEL